MVRLAAAAMVLSVLLHGPATAVGPNWGSTEAASTAGEDSGTSTDLPAADETLVTAVRLIDDGDFGAAIPVLETVLAEDPDNADALNLMGFAQRQTGDVSAAFDYYHRALAIDPEHRQALNYLGYAHLANDDVASANGVLDRLVAACADGCAEADDLADAIAAYQADDVLDY